MKKCLSVFLTLSIIASMLCGMLSMSAFASPETSNDLIEKDGVLYEKLPCVIANVSGSGVDSENMSKATDGDDTTYVTHASIGSASFKSGSATSTDSLNGIDRIDLVRIKYKDIVDSSDLIAKGWGPGVRVVGPNRRVDLPKKYGNYNLNTDGTVKDPDAWFAEVNFGKLNDENNEGLYTEDCVVNFSKQNNDKSIAVSFSGLGITIYEIEFYKKTEFSIDGANITNNATGVTNINGGQPLTVTFSDAVNKSTVTADNVKFTSDTNEVVTPVLAFSGDDKVLKFDLKDLKPNTTYTFTMSGEVKSKVGVGLGEGYSLSFTTGDIVPFPYCDGRVIKEVSDFDVQTGRKGIYVMDMKEPVSLLGISVKLKNADASKADSVILIGGTERGLFDGPFDWLPGYGRGDKKTFKNNTADAQYFLLDSGTYRYYDIKTADAVESGNATVDNNDVDNIASVKAYVSVADVESNLTKIASFSRPVAGTNMSNESLNDAIGNRLIDGKIVSDPFEPSTPLKSIKFYSENFPTTEIKKIKIWYEKTGETNLANDYLNLYTFDKNPNGGNDIATYLRKKAEFVNTNGAIGCAEIDLSDAVKNKADFQFMLIANDPGVEGITGIKLYEIEFYKELDDSAKFVSASSSTEGVDASQLAKVYDSNVDSYCEINAADVILKLENPTLASGIKIRYNDAGGDLLANYSVYAAAANDESAYAKIGEFTGGSDDEAGLTYTGMIEFSERLVRYIKITRPSVGGIQIADVRVYSKNDFETAPDGKHWENIMAGLKSGSVTAVDGTDSSVDAGSVYSMFDGRYDASVSLAAKPDAKVNVGPNKLGAQYDIDLGAVYTINSINMGWKIETENPNFTGCFTLYGSSDDSSYKKLTDFNIGVVDSGTAFASFASGNYRYLRLVRGFNTPDSFEKSAGVTCGYGLGFTTKVTELEVYGLADDSTATDMVISSNEPEKLTSGDKDIYNWTAAVRNYTGEKKTYTVLSACYNDNGLISCKMNDTVTSDAFDSEKVLNISGEIPAGTKYVRVFLWDGTANAKPLMQERTLNIAQ